MPERSKQPVWRATSVLLVLAAGYWVGGMLGSLPSGSSSSPIRERVDKRSARASSSSDERKHPIRPAREMDDSLRLSRAQWSKLIRNPQMVNVSLVDCLPEIKTGIGGVGEFLGGISTTSISSSITSGLPKPELFGQASVFGWSPEQTDRVRSLMLDYGRRLADAEKNGAFIDYPEPGRIRFDFSASRAEREELTAELRSKLSEALGERDAEVFARLSGMEGLAKALPDDYVISSKIVGRNLEIDAPGLPVPGIYLEPNAPINIHASSASYMDRRIRHLGLSIDWSHLDPRSETAIRGH